jgi:FtsP/CotA-like multicopper oxidase with cupredoxin domain
VGGSIPLAAILVNSKGWHSQEDIRQRPQSLPLTTYRIKKGEHQRYRIVNGGVSQGIIVWCEDHPITIVAADGAEVKPMPVSTQCNIFIHFNLGRGFDHIPRRAL